jgi:membrane protein implicated in regulation of membrane protease activity
LGLVGFLVSSGNIPFAVALGIALLFALLQASGVLALLAAGGEGHGADQHVDAGDHGHAHDRLGLGKLPFSLLWQTFLVVFGAAGLALNARYFDVPGGAPLVALAWTVPLSILAAYLAVALLARLLGPVFAPREQEATSRGELVGQVGVVISSKLDEEFGEIRIRDKTGHDLRVVCRLVPPSPSCTRPDGSADRTTVSENESVVVVESEGGELFVAPFEERGNS